MAIATEELPLFFKPSRLSSYCGAQVSTVRNWIRRGVVMNGVVVKLRAERIGWSYRIRRTAWEEFWRALNPDDVQTPADARERRRAQREAERRLDERLGPRRK